MVQTPVGARCQDCARLSKLPTYCISTPCYLKGIGTALGMAIACGVIWGFIDMLIPAFSFNLILAPATGYAIGEITSLSVNRKRGTGLAIIVGVAVVLSYAITWIFFRGRPVRLFDIPYHLLALGLGIFVAITRLR